MVNQQPVLEDCELWRNSQVVTPMNSESRKHCYRAIVRIRFGSLGAGNRVQLPECVLIGVRDAYPDEDAEYMGFREA